MIFISKQFYRKALIISSCLFISVLAKSQISISSSTSCVVSGTQYQYTISGNWASSNTMNWSVSGGTFVGASSGTPMPTVFIIWNNNTTSGTVSLTATSGNATLSVTVTAPLSAGAISTPTQTIAYNTIPGIIYANAGSGGGCTVNYTYQWYSSPDNSNWSLISGATAINLTYNSLLTQTTYFRRTVTETNSGSSATTTPNATVTVLPQLTGGTISGPTGTVLGYNISPGLLSSTISATGGNCLGAPVYTWQQSTDGTNYNDIDGTTGTGNFTYTPPGIIKNWYYRRKAVCSTEIAYSNTLYFQVRPQVIPGVIVPGNISIISGTNPGILTASAAQGGACSGIFTYQWYYLNTNGAWTIIAGATGLTYNPGNLTTSMNYRMQVNCGLDIVYTNICNVAIGTPFTTLVNYIKTRVLFKPLVTDIASANALTNVMDFQQTTQYFDGLGKPLQTVAMQQSSVQKDVVSINMYDNFSREIIHYLPYVANTSDGNYKNTALSDLSAFNTTQFPGEQYFYSQMQIEASPLNRVQVSLPQGNSWVGNAKGVGSQYLVNSQAEGVRIWNISSAAASLPATSTLVYGDGQLMKTVSKDENGLQVIEYKDKEGQVILKKVRLAAVPDIDHNGWLCTYYIYDDLNHLRFVLQPKAVESINGSWAVTQSVADELCFRYEYDDHNRMIIKKIPGAGEVWMVYDSRDRLVFSQDSKLRSQNQWLYTQYDNLNRPVQTGMMVYTSTLNALSSYVSSLAVTTVINPITGSNVDGSLSLLVLPQREPGITSYTSTTEIQFVDGFESESNASFIAEILPGTPVSFSGTQSININPVPSGATLTALTYSFYDEYSWTTKTYSTTDNNKVDAGTNLYADPLPSTNYKIVRGLMTGTRVRVIEDPNNLSAGKWMETASFFDNKLRSIQTQSTNFTGGLDVTTILYDFSGKVLSNYLNHQKLGGTIKTYTSATRNTYDHRGRLTLTEKKINNAAAWKRISTETYDALGQLKTKQLGSDPVITTNPLETLNYDYNIRGWLLGVNRDYAKTVSSTSNYFGFDLGYDKTDIKPTSGSSIGAFANAAYNGNIGGMLWKSTGDDQVRKYDFAYDAVNRLQVANFKQYGSTTNVFDVSDNIDYTVSNLSYDANGNIKTMQQNGWKFGGSVTIDNLTYKYFNDNSNKLQNVIDGSSDASTKLGDFRYSTAYTALLGGTKLNTVTDYSYDVNGNLTADKNKDITGITYNYLNLPSIITVTGKGSIEYIYDATGNKLKKIVHETAKPDKTTLYLFGTYQDDILQFLPQEEGRIRFIPATTSFAFDYFIKDHLGNVRMVLTDEQQAPDQYPIVTFEDANLTNEQLYYENVDVQRTAAPAGLNASTGNGAKVQLLRKSTNSIGAGKLLRVMATDKIEVMVDYYIPTATTDNSAANGVNSIVSSLLGILNGATAPALLKGNGSTITNGLNSSAPFTSFLQPQNAAVPDGQPKAYLNVIFFDDQFKFVQQNSQFFPANVSGSKQQIIKINTDAAVAVKNGYVYIYVSNESNNLVYFDNLAVTQKRGAILEETHYYPFGLTMAGISSKAAGGIENKKKFNGGSELQSKEFSDGSGLEMYDTHFRQLDPQLGRWWQIDPSPNESESPYSAMGNNPISQNDILGDTANPVVRGSQAVLATTSRTLIVSDKVRKEYVKTVSQLDPTDSKGRTAAKVAAREKTPAVMEAVAEKMRPISKEVTRTGGTASKTNVGVNATVEKLGMFGQAAGVAAVGVSVYNVATAENKPQAVAVEGGALAGAVMGGELGAKAGAAIGAFFGGAGALPGAVIGGIIGSIGGAFIGANAGDDAYKLITK